jgi:hypothetical protein
LYLDIIQFHDFEASPFIRLKVKMIYNRGLICTFFNAVASTEAKGYNFKGRWTKPHQSKPHTSKFYRVDKTPHLNFTEWTKPHTLILQSGQNPTPSILQSGQNPTPSILQSGQNPTTLN